MIFGWFFYNLFIKVIWPVYKTTTQLKRQFKNMSQQKQESAANSSPSVDTTPKEKVGEYIDFEEVK